MSEARKRAKYTLEFKMKAVRLVKKWTGGVSVTAKVLGISKASLDNWVSLRMHLIKFYTSEVLAISAIASR